MTNVNFINNNNKTTFLEKHWGSTLADWNFSALPNLPLDPSQASNPDNILFHGDTAHVPAQRDRALLGGLSCSLDGAERRAEVALDDRHSCLLLKKRIQQESWAGTSCCFVPCLDGRPLSHTGRHKHRLLLNAPAVPNAETHWFRRLSHFLLILALCQSPIKPLKGPDG